MNSLKGPFPIPDDWSHIFEPFRNPEGMVCWNGSVTYFFLFCLLFLQVITIMWFALIVRVAIRVLRGSAADDVRSDDESEVEELEYEEPQPFEEEVGVEDINFRSWERRNGSKTGASSSGVRLSGNSARKELLNRIGCEQQID
jgi:acyl-CoA-dependent ceramide synthase